MVAPTTATTVIDNKLIEWNDSYSVGIEEIDEQHKVLVDLLNEVHTAIHQRHGREATYNTLKRLGEYTRVHFAVEESLMRLLNYPAYEAHKKEHEEVVADFVEMIGKYQEGKQSSGFQLLHYLKLWLLNHIKGSDKAYAEHFIKLGIQKKVIRKSWFKS